MSENLQPQTQLAIVQDRIAEACEKVGRNPKEICLVAVTKKQDIEKINQYLRAFSNDRSGNYSGTQTMAVIAENYLQEYLKKRTRLLPHSAHFIGRLQTNKIREIVKYFDCIHSVATSKHLAAIAAEAEKINKTIEVFLQVNISDDSAKGGFGLNEVEAVFLQSLNLEPKIKLVGLMTMTYLYPEVEDVRKDFIQLKNLAEALSTKTGRKIALSMGISRDYHLAIEEGATHVRVGSEIFGDRE